MPVASRRPYVAAVTVTSAVVLIQLIRSPKPLRDNVSALVALSVLMLIIAAIGEASPEIATGFSVLILVAALFGGPNGVDAVAQKFKGYGQNLQKGSAG